MIWDKTEWDSLEVKQHCDLQWSDFCILRILSSLNKAVTDLEPTHVKRIFVSALPGGRGTANGEELGSGVVEFAVDAAGTRSLSLVNKA